MRWSYAQTNISGRVVGLDPALADSVNITLKDGSGEIIYSQVHLSQNSTFHLSSGETGGLLLEVTCPGFYSAQAALLTIGSTSDTVEIHLSPTARHQHDSRVTFHDSTSIEARFALLHMKSRFQMSVRYAEERAEFLETHGDINGFKVDWRDDANSIAEEIQGEKEPILRQELVMQYYQISVASPESTSKDSATKWIWEIPPDSPVWCYHSNLYGMLALGHMDTYPAFLDRMITASQGRQFRARLLSDRARWALATGDTATFLQTMDVLTTGYSDTKWATEASRLVHPFLHPGDRVPTFNLLSIDDTLESISSAKMVGKVYLIDFWGTWCTPCIKQMPYLHKAYERFKRKGFTIISIAFDSDIDRVMRFRRKKWHMPWLNAFIGKDYHSSTISTFGVRHFPYPILVDSRGTIVALGETLWGEQLEKALENYFHD